MFAVKTRTRPRLLVVNIACVLAIYGLYKWGETAGLLSSLRSTTEVEVYTVPRWANTSVLPDDEFGVPVFDDIAPSRRWFDNVEVGLGTAANRTRRVPHYRHGMPRLYGTVTRQLGRSRNRCDGDGRDLCVFTNLCVDHARHNTFVVFEDIDYHMRAHPAHFDLGDKGRVPLVVERVARAADHVAVIPGTAVLFHERYSNRLHVLLNAFALWRAVHETVADKQYRLVLLEDLPFRYNVTDSPVLAVYAGLARKRQPIYWLDTATGHQGPRYTCFVRAVFGVDRQMIAPILKPANEHLDEFLARKAALIASSTAPKWKKHASRVLDYAHKLKRWVPAFKRHMLAMLAMVAPGDVPWTPCRALLVRRGPVRMRHTERPAYRTIVNEAGVIALLERLGFDVDAVDFAGMTHREQAARARAVGLFIGMHGAGMANAFWTDARAAVVELHPYGFQKWGYETLVTLMGQKYVSWVNQDQNATRETWHSASAAHSNDMDSRNHWRSRDQIVDLAQLEAVLLEARAHLIGAWDSSAHCASRRTTVNGQ